MSQAEQLVAGLADLWQEGLLCDVTLQVEEKKFPVHKAVLAAASTFWKAMFTGGFKESSDKIVQVQDISSRAIEEILSCIYTNELNITDENIIEIFSAAHLTQMAGIQDQCKDWMSENIEPSTCFDYLLFAQKYEMKELQKVIDSFFLENFAEVVTQNKDSFNTVPQSVLCSYLSADDLRNNYNEMVVYQTAKDWIDANETTEENDINEIMGTVRFALIEPRDLSNIMYDEFITSHQMCQDMVKEAIKYHMNIYSQPFYEGVMNKPRGEFGLFILPNGCQYEPVYKTYKVTGHEEEPLFKSAKDSDLRSLYSSNPGLAIVYESMSSVRIANFLFVFGVDDRNFQNFTKRYDASANVWQDLKPVPRYPSIGTCAVQLEKEIFLIGGMPVDAKMHYDSWNFVPEMRGNVVFKYSVEGNCWSKCTVNFDTLIHASAVALPDKGNIYITGGLAKIAGFPHVLYTVIAYNPNSGTCQIKSRMNTSRCQHVSGIVENKLYVVGGRNPILDEADVRSIEAYDPAIDQWTITDRDIGIVTYGASSIWLDDGFCIVGGGSADTSKAVTYKLRENEVCSHQLELPFICERNVCAHFLVQ